jgi:hypothetical protein
MAKTLKAGWFKKARKKFVKNHVHSFSFCEGRAGDMYRDFTLKMERDGSNTLTHRYIGSKNEQLIQWIKRGMSYAEMFRRARSKSISTDEFTMWWSKVEVFE